MENGSENIEVKESSKKVEVDVNNERNSINRSDSNYGKKKKNKRSKSYFIIRKFGCMRSKGDNLTDVDGSFNVEAAGERKDHAPSHLVVTVNGIVGSAQNWRYAAKQFVKLYPQDVIVHCSDSNSNMLTFDGVDVMGKRLANEVMSVVRSHPNLRKISFIGHSLGGLIARYAIGKLYEKGSSKQAAQENGECRVDGSNNSFLEKESKGKIAGLEPMNFITSATPHLGSRGHKQPCVFNMSNVMAFHAYVNTQKNFRSQCFNASFDQLVGWSTSSLRRRSELPKRRDLTRNDKYPHIVIVERAETYTVQDDNSVETKFKLGKRADMEEAMIRSLTGMSWERIDVSFKGSKQRFLAHSTIQVKTKFLNSDGADVIQHMIDNFLL